MVFNYANIVMQLFYFLLLTQQTDQFIIDFYFLKFSLAKIILY